jgi:hypothetical protein
MPRNVAGRRGDFEPEPRVPVRVRDYPITGPWTQEEVVQWLIAHSGTPAWPRWRAVAATAIAIAMRSNSEPIPGGLVIIRVVPGGFQIEERTGRTL